MAKIVKDDSDDDIINVDEKVGVHGINAANDIMVVQGMLNYLQQFRVRWTKVTVPVPNGTLDKNTQQAIFDYQQFARNRQNQLNVWVAKDGSVSPFKKGVQLLHKQQWTIVAMNGDCAMLNAALRDGKDHIDAITMKFPFTVGVALGRFNPLFL
jgi:hypothetical protein